MLSSTSADSNEALASLLATATVALDTDRRAAMSCIQRAAALLGIDLSSGGRERATHAEVHRIERPLVAESALPIGARIVTRRHGYTHHGIYAGAGKVVHYAGLSRGLRRGPVEENSLSSFAAGYPVSVVSGVPSMFEGREVARRARSRIGEDNYRILTNNCEHFCEWCLRGQPRSYQIDACLAIPSRALHVTRRLIADLLSLVRLGVQTKSKCSVFKPWQSRSTEIDAGAVAVTARQCVSHRRERVRD
jgi:hypothetical protein